MNLLYFLPRYLYFSHLDECSSYEATEDVPEAGVAVPEAHDQAPGKEVSAEETTNADLDSDDIIRRKYFSDDILSDVPILTSCPCRTSWP